MYGCLLQLLSHAAFAVLVLIFFGPVIAVLYFFAPAIILFFYFMYHQEEGKIFLKNVAPFLLIIILPVLFGVVTHWVNSEEEKDSEAMRLYYGSSWTEQQLKECRDKLPGQQISDKSLYLNASDEMMAMKGKPIIGDLEYGMSPREVYDLEDSLLVSQCTYISAEKIKPLRKYNGMFDSQKRLYGIELDYYYAWGGREDWDAEVEAGLNQVIGQLTRKYGEPTVHLRNDTALHVKWNHESQVVYWYTEIDGWAYQSVLYIYLPLTYGNALLNL